MSRPEDPFVIITNQTIYDKIVSLEQAVSNITPHAGTLRDHEKRLRAVERWKYALASSTLLAAASVVIAVLQNPR